MPETETPIAPAEAPPAKAAPPPREERAKPSPKTDTRPKPQPPHAVILHNDDINGAEYVVGVLRKVFHYGLIKSVQLTFQAHFTGKAAVWSGSLEVAELKADQIRSSGPDPAKRSKGALPLKVSVEPLPQ